MQFCQVLECNRTQVPKEYITGKTLEHHGISWESIKDKSKDVSISMMRKIGNILVWLDSIEEELYNVIGHCSTSLLHLLQGYKTPSDANTDSDELVFLKVKCYSDKAASLKEELIKHPLII